MVRAKELARMLNGVDGNFFVNGVNHIEVDYVRKSITLKVRPISEYGGFETESKKDRFFPNEAGWTEENEYYYEKWKNGGNDLTYLEELEEIDKMKKHKDDIGSNTLPMDM